MSDHPDFSGFVRTHLGGFLRYAFMLSGERELASDVVQDVLVKAFRQWPRVNAADRPERYVMRMITNEFLSWRRSWSVRNIFTADVLPERPDAASDVGERIATRDDMWRRLAELPPRQRAVLVLRYYQQLDDAEISEILGCNTGTVRGYAHRALTTLRSDLTAELTRTEETR